MRAFRTARTPILLAAAVALAACGGESPTSSSSGSSGSTSSATSTSGSGSGSAGSGSSGTGSSSSGGSTGGVLLPCEADGGFTACGTPALGVDSISVQRNPNDVLTAEVIVQAHGAQTVSVRYQDPNGELGQTPAAPATGTNQLLPVLGLRPSTQYVFQAVASNGAGALARSDPETLITGALPSLITSTYTFPVTQFDGGSLPGYIMTTKLIGGTNQAAVIVDRTGRVVWYSLGNGLINGDFQKQPDHSYTIASAISNPVPYADAAIYRQLDVLGNLEHVWTVDGTGSNLHEMLLEDGGTAMLFSYATRQFDGGADGGVLTYVGNTVNRVLPDAGVLFSSSFLDDFEPSDVVPWVHQHESQSGGYVDAVHANSINVTSDGNYLLSSRSMSQVRKIDSQTGAVIWKLGGTRSDFTFPDDPLGGFSMQHFAREIAPNDILLYDDGNEHTPPQSRAVEYQLHFDSNGKPTTANLVWQYVPPPGPDGSPIYSFAMGSAQRLPDGHTLICYGTYSRIDEVDAQGNLVWQLTDPSPRLGMYRALYIDSLY